MLQSWKLLRIIYSFSWQCRHQQWLAKSQIENRLQTRSVTRFWIAALYCLWANSSAPQKYLWWIKTPQIKQLSLSIGNSKLCSWVVLSHFGMSRRKHWLTGFTFWGAPANWGLKPPRRIGLFGTIPCWGRSSGLCCQSFTTLGFPSSLHRSTSSPGKKPRSKC